MSNAITRFALIIVVIAPGLAAAQSAPLRKVEEAFAAKQSQDIRIIGGKPVKIEDNPWQLALVATKVPTNTNAQFCGGSIIAARWVVTAAHCVDNGTPPDRVAILAGTASLEKGGQRVSVTRIIVHEQWDRPTFNFDLALIETGADLLGTPIGLDVSAADPAAAQQVLVTGWGRTDWEIRAGSKDLQGVTVPYLVRATCNQPASYGGRITDNMFCAGLAQGGQDSCQGDSGGPATTLVDKTRRLVGVVSWGEGCGLRNKYGVYTRVSNFAGWITKHSGVAIK
jgi:secreted trypsin-like serine protease